MPSQALWQQAEFNEAFVVNERQERLRTGKVACALVVFLMPAGVTLDFFVYPERWAYFLQLRLLCSLLAGGLWYLHSTRFGFQHYQLLGIPTAILPASFIAWMIAVTEGPQSPYYAGLILILLAVNAVVHWTTSESLLAVATILVLYLLGCWPWDLGKSAGVFFNNVYFLLLTGIIVIVGNHLYNRLHFREFALRFELDQNRQKLEENNRKLVELDQVKSRFFANISHELRTPLTLLLAPLESLLQREGPSLAPEMRELLLIMHANGLRLLKLINDLLDLVRLDSGKMEVRRQPVEFEPFIRGLTNAARATAEDRGIQLEADVGRDIGAVLLVDGDKLEKILLNLLFNALKFTPGGGKVRLAAGRLDGELVLEVSDTGMGIDEKKLPFIFDRFWQEDTSSQRKYQGAGIGLALVKQLVEIQDGRVEVTSAVAQGTRITVRLPYLEAETTDRPPSQERDLSDQPLAASQPMEPEGEQPQEWLERLYRRAEMFPSLTSLRASLRPVETAANGGQPRVLIADDEPDMLRFLKAQLSPELQVLEAVDGQQAIEKACQFLPDVIVCDMMMPEKDGLEVCRELRHRTATRAIPILILTARADEETKLAVLSAGATDFVTKPFSSIELSVRLRNLIWAYRLQRELARQNQILDATLEQLKETEGQLVHSEKMASLGRMSAGIIHEINNPLNFAKTGLYALRGMAGSVGKEDAAEFLEILQDVGDGIDRVAHIVTDLRSFTRSGVTDVERVPVIEVVDSALRFLSNQWRDKVRIEKDIPEGQTIWANANQITQVVMNLVQNALDALENAGPSAGEPTIWLRSHSDNGESLIIVRDNGNGIAPENRHMIFDPFFTTKDVGKGMGLGLSICYRIMSQHYGGIDARSEQGKYSEFILRFPDKQVSRNDKPTN